MIRLAATFENSEGKHHRLSVKGPDTNKSADEIKASLEKFAALDLFEKDGVGLFKKVVGAKFVERIVTPIFDRTHEETDELTETALDQRIAPVKRSIQDIRDPKELILEQRMVKPGILQQLFAFPAGIDPAEVSEAEAMSLVLRMLPQGGELEDISVVEGTDPLRFRLLIKLKEEGKPLGKESPPDRLRKSRHLDREKK